MFPLLPSLRTALHEQRAYTEKIQKAQGRIVRLLFHRKGKRIGGFRKAWQTACLNAGFARLVSVKPRVIEGAPIPHDFRRTAVRNLERAGVPRSAAMKMVGHRTESIYRRYAIADEAMLREAGAKLSALHDAQRTAPRTVLPLAGHNHGHSGRF